MATFRSVRAMRSLSQSSQFGKDLNRVTSAQLARQLIQVAADAERRTDAIVKAELVTDRRGGKNGRHRPGAHLLGSFRARVIYDGSGFPIKIEMRSVARTAAVNAQESGAKAHKIPGPSVFPVAERWGGKGASTTKTRKFSNAYGKNKRGEPTVRATDIDHPGNRAIHMMKRGLEGAIKAAYQQSVEATQG